VAQPNFRQASAAAISTSESSVHRLEGEWLLLGVATWVADVSARCWAPEASIKRCSANVLSCSCSDAARARSGLGLGANGGGLFCRLGLAVGCRLRLTSPWSLSSSPSILLSIIGTPRATYVRGSPASAGLFGSSASAMAARSSLPLLLTAVPVDSRNTFFRSVSLPMCRPDINARMSKSVGGAEGCLLEDGVKSKYKAHRTLVAELRFESGSSSSTSAGLLRPLCLVFHMLLLVFLELNLVILFVAAADDSGRWLSESDSSL